MGCKKRSYRHRVYEGIFWILLLGLLLASGYRYYNRPARKPVEVYELTWPDRANVNNIVYRRWRYYFKSFSDVPSKVEKYSRADPNDSYTLEETLVIEYPADEQIRQVIKDAGL